MSSGYRRGRTLSNLHRGTLTRTRDLTYDYRELHCVSLMRVYLVGKHCLLRLPYRLYTYEKLQKCTKTPFAFNVDRLVEYEFSSLVWTFRLFLVCWSFIAILLDEGLMKANSKAQSQFHFFPEQVIILILRSRYLCIYDYNVVWVSVDCV